MCVQCELSNVLSSYQSIEIDTFHKICDLWEKERLRVFSSVSFENLNRLYNALDLYLVASRFEGGPQSIVECALSKTPIISSDVGIASHILDSKSIFHHDKEIKMEPNVEKAYHKVQKYRIPDWFKEFNEKLIKD